MALAQGTLCLLLAPHSLAGQCCTIAGPLRYGEALHMRTGQMLPPAFSYDIDVMRAADDVLGSWVAERRELAPLAGPTPPKRDDVPAADPQPQREET